MGSHSLESRLYSPYIFQPGDHYGGEVFINPIKYFKEDIVLGTEIMIKSTYRDF
jgi:hypothetical protein